MDIAFDTRDPLASNADALIVPVCGSVDQDDWGMRITTFDLHLDAQLLPILADCRFTGQKAETVVVPTMGLLPVKRLVIAGLGPEEQVSSETIRVAYAAAILVARNAGAVRVDAILPNQSDSPNVPGPDIVAAAAEAAHLATYRYTKHYGTRRSNETPLTVSTLTLLAEPNTIESHIAHIQLDRARAIATGTNLARDLVNEPASVLDPAEMESRARAVADACGLEISVLGPSQLAEIGAGALLAVGRGSVSPPRLIHLIYRPPADIASGRKIGLVGKCITFDTGGYSIKTGEGMLDMKIDMAGGAAVLGAMSALTAIACPHEVHGVICVAENMISGDAFRPGDVLTAMNGITIEILSTDAEGRLVLADGLVYTARQGAEEMIDLATLTGAAVVALGDTTAALFASDNSLADRLLMASDQTGEDLWRMPLTDALNDRIKGDVADIKNSGGRQGGAIIGALFLNHFREGLPWAHLDIAGPAMTKKGHAYTPKGATGYGVRTLLKYLGNSD